MLLCIKREAKMDAKITKQRLTRMLSYDWLKIVGVAAALILVWVLVFTMTATRITPAQQFTVFNYTENATLTDEFYNAYSKAHGDGVFSYEVIETNVNDMTTSGEYAGTILETRVATDEGDIMFVANRPDESTATTNEAGETVYERTQIQTILRAYPTNFYDLDTYFANMKTYLDGYYNGDLVNGKLDEEKVKMDFENRVRANKDKRFKKAEQIEQGKADEVARIQKYRDAYVAFQGYLQAGLVEFVGVELKNENGEAVISGNYALNICPDESKMNKLKDYTFYYKTEKTTAEDGSEVEEKRKTAQDMSVMFFKMSGVEASFEYETLLFLNYMIELSRTDAA